jgi:uncharacterized protein YpmS
MKWKWAFIILAFWIVSALVIAVTVKVNVKEGQLLLFPTQVKELIETVHS